MKGQMVKAKNFELNVASRSEDPGNQNEIMDRTSVGNDDGAHLFRDAAEAFEIGDKFLGFASAESLSVLQKSVCCKAIQVKQFADLRVCNLALAISLNDEGFERLAREFLRPGTECLYQ